MAKKRDGKKTLLMLAAAAAGGYALYRLLGGKSAQASESPAQAVFDAATLTPSPGQPSMPVPRASAPPLYLARDYSAPFVSDSDSARSMYRSLRMSLVDAATAERMVRLTYPWFQSGE